MKAKILKDKIEEHFAALLNTHMAKSPMLNPALRVEAVGFSDWGNHYLCVVITPWFMSLYLLPTENADRSSTIVVDGAIRSHVFPNGSYTFVAANDDLIGPYETCILFNSMTDFQSHSQARDVALETIRLILDLNESPQPTPNENQTAVKTNRRGLFKSAFRRGKNA